MFLNDRLASDELRTLRSLNIRSSLSEKEYRYYWSLEKGLEGEQALDERLVDLPEHVLILRDLTLEVNNTTFQIDTLLIFQNNIYLLDVKNNQGDYYLDGDIWKSVNGNEIKNPLRQIDRCVSLLRQLFQKLGFHANINASLVFVNPEFTLYAAPRRSDIIFPTQLNRFIKQLKQEPCNIGQKHHRLADQLLSNRVLNNRHETKFTYEFSQLKKGILCFNCSLFMRKLNGHRLICDQCKRIDFTSKIVLEHIDEFKFLFPSKKVNTKNIYEWCGDQVAQRTVRSILNKHFHLMSQGKASYYVNRDAAEA